MKLQASQNLALGAEGGQEHRGLMASGLRWLARTQLAEGVAEQNGPHPAPCHNHFPPHGFSDGPGATAYVVGSGLGEDGGKNFSRVARVGAGVSRLTSAIQKAEPRHMNITGI